MDEVRTAGLLFIVFWPLLALALLLAGRRWQRLSAFGATMRAQWKPALAIALLAWLSIALAGQPVLNPYPITVFCEGLIGLAIARRIAGYEPLTVSQALLRRSHWVRNLGLMFALGFVLGVVGLLLGTVGVGLVRQVAHETYQVNQIASTLPFNKAQAFFYFLWGAGIAEETTYRLVVLSLLWWLTGRQGRANWLSAFVFAIYHLTPLSGMYRTFRQFPISQLVSTVLIGLVWGYAYLKRGYETAVLAHTFSDWITVLLFML